MENIKSKNKKAKSLNKSKRAKTTTRDKKSQLNKAEKIYQSYLEKYSALSQKRSVIFNNLVKNIEQKKIESLRKNINQ